MSYRKLGCPCGGCSVSGEEDVVRRRTATLAIECGRCGRVLVAFDRAPLAFVWLRPSQPCVLN